jgi:hypothetical protein|tara:strand:+ start:33 stop:566 length:534 start_codon:yes stop_codon:yes gene_type:complete
MSEKIVRHIPSGTLTIDKLVDERQLTPRRNKTRIKYKDKNTKKDKECHIYKVSGSYTSSLSHTTSSYDPVKLSTGVEYKRKGEWKDHYREKYFRDEDEIICEKIITHKIGNPNGRRYKNEYLLEASTTHDSSNHKFLKIWKYFWTDDGGWNPLKDGIIIPIKDAKSFIKELNEHFSS